MQNFMLSRDGLDKIQKQDRDESNLEDYPTPANIHSRCTVQSSGVFHLFLVSAPLQVHPYVKESYSVFSLPSFCSFFGDF